MAFQSEGGVRIYDTKAELPTDSEDFVIAYALDTQTTYGWSHKAQAWIEINPQSWVNGVKKVRTKELYTSATVSSGSATFYLTDDGTGSGNRIFNNVYTESISMFINDGNNFYSLGNITVSADKKSITATVNRLGTVIAGIIQVVSAADGVTVYLKVKGD